TEKRFYKIAETLDSSSSDQLDWTTPAHLDSIEQLMDSLNTELLFMGEKGYKHSRYFEISNQVRDYQRKIQNHRKDPSLYNLAGHVKALIADSTQPNRLDLAAKTILKAPVYYEHAQTKMNTPNPARLKLSIRKQIAGMAYLNEDFKKEIGFEQFTQSDQEVWRKNIQVASIAIKDYVAWCNSQIVESSTIE
ncbi:MAG: hypothetical protein AAF242_17675, partial [Bacteroidota bacterium]